MTITFRPHHFLCALGFQGKGYSPQFVKNFDVIVKRLRGARGNETRIQVTEGADDVCAPCPHRRADLCTAQSKIARLDAAHGEVLGGLQAGDELTWGEAQERMVQNISIQTFHQICAPCGWRALGVCEGALKKLRAKHAAKPLKRRA